jgi:3-oxoacyl-[acyl-carrier-protein] synthase-3
MAQCRISNAAIRGVVCAVPGEPHNVEEFGGAFDPVEVQKIKGAVGLRQVYRVQPNQTAGDLCTEAANALLDDLEWDRDSVDGLIMVTQCPDYVCPATACVVHGKLGLSPSTFAYDVNLGCSGYVYGLWMASQAVASGTAKRVLLLAGDTLSRVLSPDDKSVAMLFGDAGTATALEFDTSASIMSYIMGSDGAGYESLIIPAGGFRKRPTPETFVRSKGEDGAMRSPMDLYMDGLSIFNFTLQHVGPLVRDTLSLHGWKTEQVDGFLFHQANGFMLKTLMKKLKLPADRIPINIGKYGNTSVSSIPLLLADDFSARLGGDTPQHLLLAAFGIGYSWAAVATTLSGLKVARVISSQVAA